MITSLVARELCCYLGHYSGVTVNPVIQRKLLTTWACALSLFMWGGARWGQLADLQSSQMHNQGDQSVSVCLITTPHCPTAPSGQITDPSSPSPSLTPSCLKKKKTQDNNAPHSCWWLLSTECILVPSSTPQPHIQAPTHTCPFFPKACHKGAAISQPLWQDAASLTKEMLSLLCRYDSCTDIQTTSGNHLVFFHFTGRTHSATCVRRTHLGVENDPTNKIRCCRLFLNAPLELLEATSQPEVSKQDIHNDFDTVVLISLLIWRTPPNVRRSILIVYRFIYASVKPQDEQHICL